MITLALHPLDERKFYGNQIPKSINRAGQQHQYESTQAIQEDRK